MKVPAENLRSAEPNFSQVTFWLQLWLEPQAKVSQNNVHLYFASLPCCSSNSRLEENLTKLIYRQLQYRAQIKASEMQMCQTFQLESQEQFNQLKFVETQLGTGSNTSQIKLLKSSDSGVNLGFSQLNFPKVMFSQVIVSSSSRLNTVLVIFY